MFLPYYIYKSEHHQRTTWAPCQRFRHPWAPPPAARHLFRMSAERNTTGHRWRAAARHPGRRSGIDEHQQTTTSSAGTLQDVSRAHHHRPPMTGTNSTPSAAVLGDDLSQRDTLGTSSRASGTNPGGPAAYLQQNGGKGEGVSHHWGGGRGREWDCFFEVVTLISNKLQAILGSTLPPHPSNRWQFLTRTAHLLWGVQNNSFLEDKRIILYIPLNYELMK